MSSYTQVEAVFEKNVGKKNGQLVVNSNHSVFQSREGGDMLYICGLRLTLILLISLCGNGND
jgi:hypothetical protein